MYKTDCQHHGRVVAPVFGFNHSKHSLNFSRTYAHNGCSVLAGIEKQSTMQAFLTHESSVRPEHNLWLQSEP